MTRSPELALAFALVCAPSCGGEDRVAGSSASGPWFEEVALRSGLDFAHVRAFEPRWQMPEIMGSGGAFLDYDADGFLDVFLVQSGDLEAPLEKRPGDRLFRNRGDGTFEDATARAGIDARGYGMGCAVGDYDGDGDLDLYVTNVGPNVLYRNDGGGRFSDVTEEAGVGDRGWGTSAMFVDYDGDLDLDLFVANYLVWSKEREIPCKSAYGERDYCHPNNYASPAPDVLYRNEGDGKFTNVTHSAGLSEHFGNGLGATAGDFNGDGKLDLYVANDQLPNQLWINRGDGTFRDEAALAGCALDGRGAAQASMGVAAFDLENDGDLDLFVTTLRDETKLCFVNEKGVFRERTAHTGLAAPSIPFTGFGMGFADFDLDGELDLYVANGRVGKWLPVYDEADPYAEPNLLFRGLGGGRFEPVPQGGVASPLLGNSRGAAFGDYDNDGDVDVLVNENNGPARLLRNVAPRRGHWLELRLTSAAGTEAIGARVHIGEGASARWRTVERAYSYCSSSDARVHVGLGEAAGPVVVRVHWTTGLAEEFGPLEVDREHVLRERTGLASASTQSEGRK